MRVALADKFNYRGPFDKQLIKDLQCPYRSAFLINSLNKILNNEERLLKILSEYNPEFLRNLIDAQTTHLMQGLGHKKYKGLFKKREKEEKSIDNIVITPDGVRVRIKPNL